MRRAQRTALYDRSAAAATRTALATLGILSLLCAAHFLLIATASAQSSVRPPSNATENAVPAPAGTGSTAAPARPSGGGPTAGRPTVAPPNLTAGAVPGNTLGTRSQSDIWRQIRDGATGNVSIPDKRAGQLIRGTDTRLRTRQDIIAATESRGGGALNLTANEAGINSWIAIRNGPLVRYSLYAIAGITALLAIFFLIRGRIRLEYGFAGMTIERFTSIERTGHWLLAVSFIVLALTGLNLLYGREFLIPLFGKEAFAATAYYGKLAHNYVAFAFMLALAMILVMWIRHNLPTLLDLKWLAKGGGLLTNSHPSARKFNAGQKILFWLVILGGISISMSGIALMFPFETSMFAKTFAFLNTFGAGLPTEVSAIDEQKYASLWHSIVAVFLTCVIIAHIYIGTIGMQGAINAMTSGNVDINWAREHHDLWAEEKMREEQRVVREAVRSGSNVQPAE